MNKFFAKFKKDLKHLLKNALTFYSDLTSSTETSMKVTSSIYAIIAGLLLGLVILLLTNPASALPGFLTILEGGFYEGSYSIGDLLYYAAPIIFAGLSVGFAFKTGLFNIGASGQITVGGFVAIYIGIKWTFLPWGIHWIVAFLLAGVAGALWALIPGLLKAYRNVHEVVSTIMMNYIAMYLVNYLVKTYIYFSLENRSQTVNPSAIIPTHILGINLTKLTNGSPINIGFILAILVGVLIYIILEMTTFGYQLKAVGFNKQASKYAGINEKRNIVYSMIIAGFLAGLGGAVIYLTISGRHIRVEDVLNLEGYLGIPVALIGLNNPIGIIFAGLFMGYLHEGGYYMQLNDLVPEIIDIIISAIIYFSALVLLFKQIIIWVKKRAEKTAEGGGK